VTALHLLEGSHPLYVDKWPGGYKGSVGLDLREALAQPGKTPQPQENTAERLEFSGY